MIDAAATGTPPKTRWRAVGPREWRALSNWLLVWVVLANAGFALMYVVGSPTRFFDILVFGVTGLVVRKGAYAIQVLAFLAIMVFSILSFIAGLFNLAITSLAHSIIFLAELEVGQSIEYILGGVIVVGLVSLAGFILRGDTAFQDQRMALLAALATVFLALFDLYMSYGMQGHYNRAAANDAPFDSAVVQSQVVPQSGVLERNLVMIMVESMGVPVGNDAISELLFSKYDNPAVQARFEISTGTTTYFSSTTSGEIRELCGRWGEYYDLRDAADDTCLPARLASKGVATSAYHSFDSGFFDRNLWYPNIGFQNAYFRYDLVKGGAARCGGVFPGACDRDVPAQLAARLKSSNEPQFVYWLTVNSHLPVPLEGNLQVENCDRTSSVVAQDFPMICRQFAIWESVDEALIKQILAPDFPPTDILIVGDHMPPYFDRHNRSQFAPDRVPWLLLKWRG